MITISIEIHFTTLYMADLGTRAEQKIFGVGHYFLNWAMDYKFGHPWRRNRTDQFVT
jgi:hypothetical protein